jgi:hypothetical protein
VKDREGFFFSLKRISPSRVLFLKKPARRQLIKYFLFKVQMENSSGAFYQQTKNGKWNLSMKGECLLLHNFFICNATNLQPSIFSSVMLLTRNH